MRFPCHLQIVTHHQTPPPCTRSTSLSLRASLSPSAGSAASPHLLRVSFFITSAVPRRIYPSFPFTSEHRHPPPVLPPILRSAVRLWKSSHYCIQSPTASTRCFRTTNSTAAARRLALQGVRCEMDCKEEGSLLYCWAS